MEIPLSFQFSVNGHSLSASVTDFSVALGARGRTRDVTGDNTGVPNLLGLRAGLLAQPRVGVLVAERTLELDAKGRAQHTLRPPSGAEIDGRLERIYRCLGAGLVRNASPATTRASAATMAPNISKVDSIFRWDTTTPAATAGNDSETYATT
jgi:hypothetical protein